jgi:Topoisomerase IA
MVAEKRSVAQAIAKYLGGTYRLQKIYGVATYYFRYNSREATALGLSGHLMDFDFAARQNIWTWLPPEGLFQTPPLLVARGETLPYLKALRSLAYKAEEVYLALDADVEGEAIAYETALAVRLINRRAKMYRVRFNAVTYKDIRAAFQKPTRLDLKQAEKVFTRMQIDLTLGAVFTRFLTLTVKNSLQKGQFLSYGPCQTPVLGMVVARELERRNFKPEKYYVIKALVEIGGNKIEMSADIRFKTRKEAEAAAATIRQGVVKAAIYKPHHVQPPDPLDTVELERRASRWLGISSKKTLDVAEELYRAGYISYPRTETTIYPPTLDLREVLQELAATEHGDYAEELLSEGSRPPEATQTTGPTRPSTPQKPRPKPRYTGPSARRATTRGHIRLCVRHFLATPQPTRVS